MHMLGVELVLSGCAPTIRAILRSLQASFASLGGQNVRCPVRIVPPHPRETWSIGG
jgi:hypothetical protein